VVLPDAVPPAMTMFHRSRTASRSSAEDAEAAENELRDKVVGYVHWLGKGKGTGDTGQQEWVFRMYNLDNTTETPPRPNHISYYVFNREGGEGWAVISRMRYTKNTGFTW
jgi:hypothetical protein